MLLLLSCIAMIGCGGNEPKATDSGEADNNTTTKAVSGEVDYDEMAIGFCNCMRPMFDFQEKVMKLLSEENTDAVEALRDEALKVQQDGESCILKLEEKYGVVEGPEQEAKATEALTKACPEIMAMMGEAAGQVEE